MSENKIVKSVNNIFEITKNDVKAAFSNPLVVLTLIGIIILPSLYANLNIMACWDPYDNTDHLEIAIANSDQKATYGNTTLNIGNEVVKELKKNDKFDWTFVSESDAREGVKNGRYYSAMIIPKNFSSNIASIDSDEPKPATLEYLVNEKSNPVASRMSDSASKELQRKVSSNIVKVLDVMAVEKLTILKTALASGSTKLSSGAAQVSSGASQVSSGASKVNSGSKKLTDGSKQITAGSKKITKGSKQITAGSKKLSSGSKKMSSGSKQLGDVSNKLSDGASKAKYGADEVSKGASTINQYAKNADIPDPTAKKVIVDGSEKVAEVSGQISNGLGELSVGGSKVASGSNQIAKSGEQLASGSNKLASSTEQLAKGTNKLASSTQQLANGSNQIAKGSVKLADGAVSLASGSSKLATASASALLSASDSLDGITGINKEYLGDYFYSPVILKRNALNPIKDYGSEVAPFYLILSIWVGCIVTCVMIKMRFLNDKRYKPIEVYFGKMVMFLVMAVLQTTVTMIWVWSLGIEIENMYLFIFSMYIIGLVFMFLMYSLVSIFGLVGEGVAIVLLVLQISSTGGIYPVEVMPAFFKAINPFMPMTYAITMVREACLGLYLPNYINAISILLIFPIVMFVIAIIIKGAGRIDKKVNYVEGKLEESGLF